MGIHGNERADAAAKAALLQLLLLPITGYAIPYVDFKPKIDAYFRQKWQDHWANIIFNKLKPIKPILC